ncbi:MAG: ATP-binding protein [Legionellaceae bacterium]|nr:ATP-binding protein [Legionellaceae bacterium]
MITGAPSSGKTTLINALSIEGYRTEPEVARAYILYLLAKGEPVRAHNRGEVALQKEILHLKLKREIQLPKEELIFFDRGMPDSLAYYRYYGLDESDILEKISYCRYKYVFYLEGLPLVTDTVRLENESEARLIGEHIYDAYRDFGYKPIRIPPVSVQQRMKLILSEISDLLPHQK